MITRGALVTLVVVCGVASVDSSNAVIARGGSAGAGHAGFAGHSFRTPGPGFGQFGRSVPARAIASRRPALRQSAYWAWPSWWGTDNGDPYYYYPAGTASAPATTGTEDTSAAQRPVPVVVYQPGCRTQQQTVPSEAGGTRTVNITRCY